MGSKEQNFILSELEKLKGNFDFESFECKSDELKLQIEKYISSSKFRKYANSDYMNAHIKESVDFCVEQNQKINITFLHGCYKLYRLEEAPEADFAELFALMYYALWLKPICEIYKPGVVMDFLVDDLIMEKLDNYKKEEVDAYYNSYKKLMEFVMQYTMPNFEFKLTRVSSLFESEKAFWESLDKNLQTMPQAKDIALSESMAKSIELNYRPIASEQNDPLWKEKNLRIHNAYLKTKAEPGYHMKRIDKILAFTQRLGSGTVIAVGSTKNSIMKFWVGVGVLKVKGESFEPTILSQSQLENYKVKLVPINIDGLDGKNFGSIRVVKEK